MADDDSSSGSNRALADSQPDMDDSASDAAQTPRPLTKPANPSSSTASTASPLRKASSSNLTLSLSPAIGMSPRTSRNNSPIRKDKPPPLAGPLSTQPSAAAIQRALSASSIPQLQHSNSNSESASRLPRVQKSGSMSGESSPQWPMSPRVKSPPPATIPSRKNSGNGQRKTETGNAPTINIQSATPQSAASVSPPAKLGGAETSKPEQAQQIPVPLPKGPSRGPGGKSTLETVQENSGDSITDPSPAAIQAAADLRPLTRISSESMRKPKRDYSRSDLEKLAGESGSESAGNRSDHRRGRRPSASNASTTSKQKQANLKHSFPVTTSSKGRQSDGKQNMTVETETVQSIPQSALASSDRYDHSGSIKLKASNETIRPRKNPKKQERKARSVTQGPALTKADLFEARVANAVDEANTSDSDETFVYESNPPEHQRRQRHHSRTPSVTSAHSIAEQSRGSVRHYSDAHPDRRVGGKRSMKFSSVYSDVTGQDSIDGTVRSHTPRHIGRHGRGGHQSASHDPDSPFTKMRNSNPTHLGVQRQSRPTSPGSPPMASYRPSALFGRKQEQSFDLDAEGADDERTPLMGSHHRQYRHIRNMHMRRLDGGPPSYGSDSHSHLDGRTRWCTGRAGIWLVILVMVVLVLVSAFGVAFSSNRPLYDVRIRKIENVLATEQELILDLVISAVNPNAMNIVTSDVDVDIFAKSKHIGGRNKDDGTQTPNSRTIRLRRHDTSTANVEYNPNPSQDPSGHWQPPDHDHGTDPDPDLEKDTVTIPLGNVSHFDQALFFEGSPIKRYAHDSIGSLRLRKPGNNTDPSGIGGNGETWAKMLEYPFELIVRGPIRYKLPISQRWQNAVISAAVMVHPEEGVDRQGNMRTEPVNKSGRWEWIEWPDYDDAFLGSEDR